MIVQRQAHSLPVFPIDVLGRDAVHFHRDAIFYRTNQFAQIATHAFFLVDRVIVVRHAAFDVDRLV